MSKRLVGIAVFVLFIIAFSAIYLGVKGKKAESMYSGAVLICTQKGESNVF